MPYFISTVVICGMLKAISRLRRRIQYHSRACSARSPVIFLSEPQYFQTILVWSSAWQGEGWGSFIYMAALSGIDMEMYEAARNRRHAGRFRQLWHVTIPGIVPRSSFLLVLNIGSLLAVSTDRYCFCLRRSPTKRRTCSRHVRIPQRHQGRGFQLLPLRSVSRSRW